MQISGKQAMVTGAASGIGRAIAEALAREGAQLYLTDVDQAALSDVASTLRAQGACVIARPCDLRHPRDLDDCLDDLLARWGGVDILVNNAGVAYYGPTAGMSDEQWDCVLQVNLLAPSRIIRRLLPSLGRRPGSQIVNICSLAGLVAFRRAAAYSLTKFGLVGLSEALRIELARYDIGVTAICPGFVRTGLFRGALTAQGTRGTRIPHPWLTVSPELVARRVIAAIRNNRSLVVISFLAQLLWSLKRLSPRLWVASVAAAHRSRGQRAPTATPAAAKRAA